MKTLYNNRITQYVIYGFLYMIIWKFAGFEISVLLCLSTILGEIHYQEMNRK